MEFFFDTGGREKYYKQIFVGDCATRAIAIANHLDYKIVYNMMRKIFDNSPRNGVTKEVTDDCLKILGWDYVNLEFKNKKLSSFETLNSNCIFRLQIAEYKTHIVAYINGMLHDTFDCSRINPVVLGYWIRN